MKHLGTVLHHTTHPLQVQNLHAQHPKPMLQLKILKCINQVERKHNVYLMFAGVEPAIGCPKPDLKSRIVPPVGNLLLKHLVVAALHVKIQEPTWQQMEQTWGLNWGPQGGFGDIHNNRSSGCSCRFDIEGLAILPQPRCNIMLTS